MGIFDLAVLQVQRERQIGSKNELALIVERAITIRRYLDLQERGKAISKGKRG